jgi:hypothetical protein
LPYKVHPWIERSCSPAVRNRWVPNPTRATFYESLDGRLAPIDDSDYACLKAGDIVKMSFKVLFIVLTEQWWIELEPVQFIRVESVVDGGSANEEQDSQEEATVDLPQVGEILVPVEGKRLTTNIRYHFLLTM